MPAGGRRARAVRALLLSRRYAVSTASRRSMPVGDRRSCRARSTRFGGTRPRRTASALRSRRGTDRAARPPPPGPRVPTARGARERRPGSTSTTSSCGEGRRGVVEAPYKSRRTEDRNPGEPGHSQKILIAAYEDVRLPHFRRLKQLVVVGVAASHPRPSDPDPFRHRPQPRQKGASRHPACVRIELRPQQTGPKFVKRLVRKQQNPAPASDRIHRGPRRTLRPERSADQYIGIENDPLSSHLRGVRSKRPA